MKSKKQKKIPKAAPKLAKPKNKKSRNEVIVQSFIIITALITTSLLIIELVTIYGALPITHYVSIYALVLIIILLICSVLIIKFKFYKITHKKNAIITTLIVILVTLLGSLLTFPISPSQETVNAIKNNKTNYKFSQTGDLIYKKEGNKSVFIMFTGAFTTPATLGYLVNDSSQSTSILGYDIYIIRSPYNFALLNYNSIDSIVKNYDKAVIGGYSVGGTAANFYINSSKNPKVAGVFLLGSYFKDPIYEQDKIKLMQVLGVKDGLIDPNEKQVSAAEKNLYPTQSKTVLIQDANHTALIDANRLVPRDNDLGAAKNFNPSIRRNITTTLINFLRSV